MAGKKDPGRFTLHFNLNDPQQKEAVEILNRNGRQKASLIARALLYYMELPGTSHEDKSCLLDHAALEQAVLSVLTKKPHLIPDGHIAKEPVENTDIETKHMVPSPTLSDTMDQNCRDAIQKTLSSFWAK